MEFQGKITNAKFRSGKNELTGREWQACDYYVVETGKQYGSEMPFTLFNDIMLGFALHEGAEGMFDIQIYNEQRNGYNNMRVRLNGFKGIDNGKEKCVGVYARTAEAVTPDANASGTVAAPQQTGAAPFDPAQSASSELPFD